MITIPNNFKTWVGNEVNENLTGIQACAGSQILEAINRYHDRLNATQSFIDEFCMICNNEEFIPDGVLENVQQTFVTLSVDVAQQFYDCIVNAIDNAVGNGLTISTIDGRVLCFVKDLAGNIYTDGSAIAGVANRIIESADITNIRYMVRTLDGHFVTILNLINSLSICGSMNTMLLQACRLIKFGKFTSESFAAACSSFINDAHPSCKDMYNQIQESYAQGGIIGAAKRILQYCKGATLVSTDQDGYLVFTDNSTLAPQQYIAGVITQVVGSVVALAGVIVSIFSKIIGIAISFIGTALVSLGKIISYDYNVETLSALQDSTNELMLQCAPHGFFCCDFDDTYHNLDEVLDQMGAFYIEVVGGVILVSRSPNPGKYRAEFHPSLEIMDPDATYFERAGQDVTLPDSSQYFRVFFTAYKLDSTRADNRRQLLNMWAGRRRYDFTFTPNQRLTAESDLMLRLIILSNVAWFMLYSESNISPYNQVQNKRWYPGLYVSKASPYNMSLEGFGSLTDWQQAYISCFQALCAIERYTSRWPSSLSQARWVSDPFPWTKVSQIATLFNNDNGFNTSAQYLIPINYATAAPANDQIGSSVWNASIYYAGNQPASTTHVPGDFYNGRYFGQCNQLPDVYGFAVLTPKYDRSTFWYWVAAIGITVAVTTVAVITISVAGAKYISRNRAYQAAKVERAWNDFVENPSAANYNAYKNQVFKNNAIASIFKGTKYSKESYWASTQDDNDASLLKQLKANFLSDDSMSDEIKLIREIKDISNNILINTGKFDYIISLIRGNLT